MKYNVAHFRVECPDEMLQTARELLSAAACEAGFEAFEDTDDGVDGYVQRQLFDRAALDNAVSDYLPETVRVVYDVEEVPDQDWNQGWEEQGFDPIDVDGRLTVYDAKHTDRSVLGADGDVKRVFIEARNAFGTGTHQTTRMILRRLLDMDVSGRRVLDCGCGTGILGIAASLLGASEVLAYDIDEWSADNARHNAAINGVGNMEVLLGDASVLSRVVKKYDVVIANINRNILIADMKSFRSCMDNDSGRLLLSGFYEADVPLIEDAAAGCGLGLCDVATDGDWACAMFAVQKK